MRKKLKRMFNNRNIYIVGPYPPPYGGISVHVQNLSKYLTIESYNVRTLSIAPYKKDAAGENNKSFCNYRDLLSYLLKNQAGIIHVHLSGIKSFRRLFATLIVKILNGSKIIITLHSGSFTIDLKKINIFLRFAIMIAFKAVNHIICVNDEIKKDIVRNFNIDKCSVIPAFAINCDLKNQKLDQDLSQFINKHSPLLLAMGYTYEKHYGFELAIQSVMDLRKKYPTAGLLIAGPKNSGKEYLGLIEKYNLKNNKYIKLAGEIEYPRNLIIMKESSIFLRPTEHDGDAVSIREALSIKTPVIATKTAYRPNGIHLFEINNLIQLKKLINQILERNEKYEKNNKVVDIKNLAAVKTILSEV